MCKRAFAIIAAGEEYDSLIATHWREQWKANERPISDIAEDQMELMVAYIRNARSQQQHQSFVAMAGGCVVGSAACQSWSGLTFPHVVKDQKVGTVWGVFVQEKWRRRGVATQLMRAVIEYWRSINCDRGVLLCASDEARRVYARLGFGDGKMMLLDLEGWDGGRNATAAGDISVHAATRGSDDDLVQEHWRSSLLAAGMTEAELAADFHERTRAFIDNARPRLEYEAYVARDASGDVVGSASCQVWDGPGSNNATWQRRIKLGVVWGVHVQPEHRAGSMPARQQLLGRVVARWKEIGCTRGLVFANSEADADFYRVAGFEAHNGMCIELGRANSPRSPVDLSHRCAPLVGTGKQGAGKQGAWAAAAEARSAAAASTEASLAAHGAELAPLLASGAELSIEEQAFVDAVRQSGAELAHEWSAPYVALLRLALPQMVDAVIPATPSGAALRAAVAAAQVKCGTFIDQSDNWYTQNLVRFGGGFDMKELTAQPGLLASKFDRLANKYDQWTAGNGCKYYTQVQRWCEREAGEELRGVGATTVDVACGIGLPGHMLRLCGFKGQMIGTDISQGMLQHARERRVFDRVFTANASEGLAEVADSSVDLVICMGAMELLDHAMALGAFARVLRPGGRLWASFQWEDAVDETGGKVASATAHQNIVGVTLAQLTAELRAAGFDAASATVEKSACAFYTPSPKQDGSVLPVPYLYVSAGLASET